MCEALVHVWFPRLQNISNEVYLFFECCNFIHHHLIWFIWKKNISTLETSLGKNMVKTRLKCGICICVWHVKNEEPSHGSGTRFCLHIRYENVSEPLEWIVYIEHWPCSNSFMGWTSMSLDLDLDLEREGERECVCVCPSPSMNICWCVRL